MSALRVESGHTAPVPPSRNAYTNHGCRCDDCREAWRVDRAAYAARPENRCRRRYLHRLRVAPLTLSPGQEGALFLLARHGGRVSDSLIYRTTTATPTTMVTLDRLGLVRSLPVGARGHAFVLTAAGLELLLRRSRDARNGASPERLSRPLTSATERIVMAAPKKKPAATPVAGAEPKPLFDTLVERIQQTAGDGVELDPTKRYTRVGYAGAKGTRHGTVAYVYNPSQKGDVRVKVYTGDGYRRLKIADPAGIDAVLELAAARVAQIRTVQQEPQKEEAAATA